MAFPDAVADLYRRGLLPSVFRVADIYRHLRRMFSEKYIRTGLANYAEGGNYAIQGTRARFRRVSRGAYQLI